MSILKDVEFERDCFFKLYYFPSSEEHFRLESLLGKEETDMRIKKSIFQWDVFGDVQWDELPVSLEEEE